MRLDLFAKSGCSNKKVEEAPVEFVFVYLKQEIVAANDRAFQFVGNNPEAPNFRVDFGNQEFARSANLLFFRLDERAIDDVAKDNSLGVKLHTATFVGLEVIDLDEFLAVGKHLPQPHHLPPRHHFAPPFNNP